MSERKNYRTKAAADYVGLSPRTLEKLRLGGRGPRYSTPAGLRVVIYTRDDLDEWLAAGRRQSTSDPGEAAAS